MAKTLSPSEQLRLDHALQCFAQWRTVTPLQAAPTALSVFQGGLSNTSLLVEDTELRRYVVRIGALSDAAASGLPSPINRHAEYQALVAAAEQGIAPTPRFCDFQSDILVCDHLESTPATHFDARGTASLLRQIHALPPLNHQLDLAHHFRGYMQRLQGTDENGLLAVRDSLQRYPETLRRLDAFNEPSVLCHNDLLPANRMLAAGQWYALDWEYCTMGNRWFDIAVVLWGEQAPTDYWPEFAGDYLQDKPTDAQLEQLRLCYALYGLLEWLWCATNPAADMTTDIERVLAAFEHCE